MPAATEKAQVFLTPHAADDDHADDDPLSLAVPGQVADMDADETQRARPPPMPSNTAEMEPTTSEQTLTLPQFGLFPVHLLPFRLLPFRLL